MIALEGKQVWLEADIPQMARRWRNHPEIRRWCRQFTDISETDHQRWLDRITKDPTIRMYGVVSKLSGIEVGVCGLTSIDQVNQKAEFSLYIQPNEQGKGYGRAALQTLCHHGFHDMNLNRIWGEVFEGNPAMKMFLEVGFRPEGTLHDSYFRNGTYIDSTIIGLLRSKREW